MWLYLTIINNYFINNKLIIRSAPQIGHLYTAVLADAAHRWNCMVGGANGCVQSTGTDEHGIKIQQAAGKMSCTPQQLCDQILPR